MDKKNIYLLFGGESPEHEISIITAKQALRHIDKDKYNIFPIYIDKSNSFFHIPNFEVFQTFKDFPKLKKLPINILISQNKKDWKVGFNALPKPYSCILTCHGGFGEGGSLQALLDLFGYAYTGPSLRGAIYGIDKVAMKEIMQENGIELIKWMHLKRNEWDNDKNTCTQNILGFESFPLIVKPASLGSSIGVKKVESREDLIDAIEENFLFDDDVIIEKFGENMKEINCSVARFEGRINTSELEEVNNTKQVFSYDEKYLKGGKKSKTNTSEGMASASRNIPAAIDKAYEEKIKDLAIKVYDSLLGESLSRIDFLLDENKDKVYPIEINTIPGSLSYYLWEATGMQFHEVIDKLIEESVRVLKEKQKKITSFDSPLWES